MRPTIDAPDQPDPLGELLTHSSPLLQSDLQTFPIRRSLDEIAEAARTEAGLPARPRSRQRVRRAVAAVSAIVGVAVAVSGVPAAADWVSLHTGRHDVGSPRDPQPKTDENELWRMDSPELRPYLEEFARDYPLAPGYTIEPLTRTTADPYPTLVSKLGVRGTVFFFSECTWVDTWLRADRSGDRAAKTTATTVLQGLPDKLEHPVAIAIDQTGKDLQRDLAEAARTDSPAVLRRELTLNCGDLQ